MQEETKISNWVNNIREKINPVVKIRQRLWRILRSKPCSETLTCFRKLNFVKVLLRGKSNFYYGVKPTLNKVLSFLLLIGIAFSIVQIAHAESIGEFLEELLPQAIQNNEPSPPAPAVSTADKSAYALSDTIRISNTPEESTSQSEEAVPIPQGFVADKSFYTNVDTIRISNTPAGSTIKIYWLDNPETAENPDPDSRPSNVYAALVNDDGTVNIEAATLPAGRFVFVNTFEPGHCGGFYLSQCRARNDYLGEISLSINP